MNKDEKKKSYKTAKKIDDVIDKKKALEIPVTKWDERLTTVMA